MDDDVLRVGAKVSLLAVPAATPEARGRKPPLLRDAVLAVYGDHANAGALRGASAQRPLNQLGAIFEIVAVPDAPPASGKGGVDEPDEAPPDPVGARTVHYSERIALRNCLTKGYVLLGTRDDNLYAPPPASSRASGAAAAPVPPASSRATGAAAETVPPASSRASGAEAETVCALLFRPGNGAASSADDAAPVRSGARVLLEAASMRDHYVRVGADVQERAPEAGDAVVMSVYPFEYFVVLQRGPKVGPIKALAGGDYISMRKMGADKWSDGYIAAEGVYAKGWGVGEDVHLRYIGRNYEHIHDRHSLSASSWWQVEVTANLSDGNVLEDVEWDDHVRLRHLPSRKYLAFNTEDSSLTLSEHAEEPDTAFAFAMRDSRKSDAVASPPVLTATSTLATLYHPIATARAYVRLKSTQPLQDGQAGAHCQYKFRQYDAVDTLQSATRATYLRWDDNASCRILECTDTDDDGGSDRVLFLLEAIPKKYIHDFDAISGFVHELCMCEPDPKPAKLTATAQTQAAEILGRLVHFIENGARTDQTQLHSLVRHMRLVDRVMALVKLDLENLSHTHPMFRKAALSFVSTFLDSGTLKNGIYLVRHVDTFLAWIDDEKSKSTTNAHFSAEILLKIISDNQIVLNHLGDAIIAKVHSILSRRLVAGTMSVEVRDSNRHLYRLLEATCICNGSPISSAQLKVANMILELSRDTNAEQFLKFFNGFELPTKSAHQAGISAEVLNIPEAPLDVYASQIDLYATVCNERPSLAQLFSKNICPLKTCYNYFINQTETSTNDDLRAACLRYAMVLWTAVRATNNKTASTIGPSVDSGASVAPPSPTPAIASPSSPNTGGPGAPLRALSNSGNSSDSAPPVLVPVFHSVCQCFSEDAIPDILAPQSVFENFDVETRARNLQALPGMLDNDSNDSIERAVLEMALKRANRWGDKALQQKLSNDAAGVGPPSSGDGRGRLGSNAGAASERPAGLASGKTVTTTMGVATATGRSSRDAPDEAHGSRTTAGDRASLVRSTSSSKDVTDAVYRLDAAIFEACSVFVTYGRYSYMRGRNLFIAVCDYVASAPGVGAITPKALRPARHAKHMAMKLLATIMNMTESYHLLGLLGYFRVLCKGLPTLQTTGNGSLPPPMSLLFGNKGWQAKLREVANPTARLLHQNDGLGHLFGHSFENAVVENSHHAWNDFLKTLRVVFDPFDVPSCCDRLRLPDDDSTGHDSCLSAAESSKSSSLKEELKRLFIGHFEQASPLILEAAALSNRYFSRVHNLLGIEPLKLDEDSDPVYTPLILQPSDADNFRVVIAHTYELRRLVRPRLLEAEKDRVQCILLELRRIANLPDRATVGPSDLFSYESASCLGLKMVLQANIVDILADFVCQPVDSYFLHPKAASSSDPSAVAECTRILGEYAAVRQVKCDAFDFLSDMCIVGGPYTQKLVFQHLNAFLHLAEFEWLRNPNRVGRMTLRDLEGEGDSRAGPVSEGSAVGAVISKTFDLLQHMARCITNVFVGNLQLSMKLEENSIKRLVALLDKCEGQCSNLLNALSVIAKVDSSEMPIERHQTQIVQSLRRLWRSWKLLDDSAHEYARVSGPINVSEHGSYRSPSERIRSTIFLVRLLATCCEGNGRSSNRAACATVLSMETVHKHLDAYDAVYERVQHLLSHASQSSDQRMRLSLRILNDELKVFPYMRFFLWVYVMPDTHQLEKPLKDGHLLPAVREKVLRPIKRQVAWLKKTTTLQNLAGGYLDVWWVFALETACPFFQIHVHRFATIEKNARIQENSSVGGASATSQSRETCELEDGALLCDRAMSLEEFEADRALIEGTTDATMPKVASPARSSLHPAVDDPSLSSVKKFATDVVNVLLEFLEVWLPEPSNGPGTELTSKTISDVLWKRLSVIISTAAVVLDAIAEPTTLESRILESRAYNLLGRLCHVRSQGNPSASMDAKTSSPGQPQPAALTSSGSHSSSFVPSTATHSSGVSSSGSHSSLQTSLGHLLRRLSRGHHAPVRVPVALDNRDLNVLLVEFMSRLTEAYQNVECTASDPHQPTTSLADDNAVKGNLPKGFEFREHRNSLVAVPGKPDVCTSHAHSIVAALKFSSETPHPVGSRARALRQILDLKHMRLLRAAIGKASERDLNARDGTKRFADTSQSDKSLVNRFQSGLVLRDPPDLVDSVGPSVASGPERASSGATSTGALPAQPNGQSHVAVYLVRLTHSKDELVVRAALRLLAAILDRGNMSVKEILLKHFRQENDGRFVLEMDDRLRQSQQAFRASAEMLAWSKAISVDLKCVFDGLRDRINKYHDANESRMQPPQDASLNPLSKTVIQTDRQYAAAADKVFAERFCYRVFFPIGRIRPTIHSQPADDCEESSVVLKKFRRIVGYAELVLLVAERLCDGPDDSARRYLTNQDTGASVNLVATIDRLLKSIYREDVYPDSIGVVARACITVAHIVMGSPQTYISGSIYVVNNLLERSHFLILKGTPTAAADALQFAFRLVDGCFSIVLHMLVLARRPHGGLVKSELGVLRRKMILNIVKACDSVPDNQSQKTNTTRLRGLGLIILHSLVDLLPDKENGVAQSDSINSNQPEKTGGPDKAGRLDGVQRAARLIHSVEVYTGSDNHESSPVLERVFFDAGEVSQFLSSSHQESIWKHVLGHGRVIGGRDLPHTEQLSRFVEACQSVIPEMRFQEQTIKWWDSCRKKQSNRLVLFSGWMARHIQSLVTWLVLIDTFLINAIMLGSWHANSGNFYPVVPAWYDPVFYTFAGIHILLSVALVLLHFAGTWYFYKDFRGDKRDAVRRAWARKLESAIGRDPATSGAGLYSDAALLGKRDPERVPDDTDQAVDDKLSFAQKIGRMCSWSFWLETLQPLTSWVTWKRSLTVLVRRKTWSKLRLNLKAYQVFDHIYYIAFLGLSVGGLVTRGYLYCFHLLHVIRASTALRDILKSVTRNGKTLMFVFALGLIVIYIFAVVAFAAFSDDFGMSPNGQYNQGYCDTLFQCFVSLLFLSLTQGIGFLVINNGEDDSWDSVGQRVVFELLFYILILVIGLNIVLSIIVNTFWEIRAEAEKSARLQDMQCFICGMPASKFDQGNGHQTGFHHHRSREHNMWSYLHYINYVKLKHESGSDLTNTEAHVLTCLDKPNKTEWFPVGRAISVQVGQSEHLH